MTKPAPALERIGRELERIGLLMQHDAELPSFTTLAAGEPIRGSWWADPRCHEIYDLMQVFHDRKDVLTAKVVNRKVTLVHARLWPALLAVAQDPAPERTRKLADVGKRLYERVTEQGVARADELRKSGFADTAEITKAARELEAKLLVHADDVHTESGAHAKVLQTWKRWAEERGVAAGALTVAQAKQQLEQAVQTLSVGASRPARVPW